MDPYKRRAAASRRNGRKGGRPARHGINRAELPHPGATFEELLENYKHLLTGLIVDLRVLRSPAAIEAKRGALLKRFQRIEKYRRAVRLPAGAIVALAPDLAPIRRAFMRGSLAGAMQLIVRLLKPPPTPEEEARAEEKARLHAEALIAADELENGPPPPPGG